MLTKSHLASFRQCPRKLWLEHHTPDKATPNDATTTRRARDGAIVGAKAREALGPAVVWGKADPTLPAVEAPLIRDNLYARADALIPTANGYVLQETKASSYTDKPKRHHLDDLAIQLWVFAASNLPLARAELNLLDNQWRYPGGGDYRGLFRQFVVGEEINERVAQVPEWLSRVEAVLAGAMPAAHTGKQCTEPYACPFFNHCSMLDPLCLVFGVASTSQQSNKPFQLDEQEYRENFKCLLTRQVRSRSRYSARAKSPISWLLALMHCRRTTHRSVPRLRKPVP